MPTIYKPKRKTTRTNTDKRKERQAVYQSSRWQKLRLAYLVDNPNCEACLKRGVVTPAVDVHHKISFVGVANEVAAYELAYTYDNLMSLCKECHQKIHNGGLNADGSPKA